MVRAVRTGKRAVRHAAMTVAPDQHVRMAHAMQERVRRGMVSSAPQPHRAKVIAPLSPVLKARGKAAARRVVVHRARTVVREPLVVRGMVVPNLAVVREARVMAEVLRIAQADTAAIAPALVPHGSTETGRRGIVRLGTARRAITVRAPRVGVTSLVRQAEASTVDPALVVRVVLRIVAENAAASVPQAEQVVRQVRVARVVMRVVRRVTLTTGVRVPLPSVLVPKAEAKVARRVRARVAASRIAEQAVLPLSLAMKIVVKVVVVRPSSLVLRVVRADRRTVPHAVATSALVARLVPPVRVVARSLIVRRVVAAALPAATAAPVADLQAARSVRLMVRDARLVAAASSPGVVDSPNLEVPPVLVDSNPVPAVLSLVASREVLVAGPAALAAKSAVKSR